MKSGDEQGDLTRLLLEIRSLDATDTGVRDRLFTAVYEELRGLARSLLRRERPGETLRPTALVHEAYLRLIRHPRVSWQDRAHFFGIAARAMRQILVEHARRRDAGKRGGGLTRVTLDEGLEIAGDSDLDLLSLHLALEKLTSVDPRAARVAELRAFGGLTSPEAAEVLGVSKRTVDADWCFARLWIRREISTGPA